ncbi:MAG: YbaB/EbfC family nucleoid-associated protein [Bdellovibrionaceae bacterium]|nr:YbaB/EbfC family nucleoid-associated protein [Pseudobdellovibrionaceae bacterium]
MKGNRGAHSMQAIIKQANQMQTRMKKLQDDLALKEYTASSGGDGVKVVVASDKLKSIAISADVFKSADAETLQDMIITAVNEALIAAKADHDQQVQELSKNFNIPGLT